MKFAVLALSAALFWALSASAETILSKSDLRLWETVHDRSSALEWPWEEGADSATLTFSNCVTHAVSTVTVKRDEGETRGVCAHPETGAGLELLLDVALVQKSGGHEVAREMATLAYVSGAGGGPITVRTSGARDWKRFYEPRIFAVDPVWQGLVGDSGYDVAWPECMGFGIILR